MSLILSMKESKVTSSGKVLRGTLITELKRLLPRRRDKKRLVKVTEKSLLKKPIISLEMINQAKSKKITKMKIIIIIKIAITISSMKSIL